MTREEVITELQMMQLRHADDDGSSIFDDTEIEAIDMAIKALKQPEVIICDDLNATSITKEQITQIVRKEAIALIKNQIKYTDEICHIYEPFIDRDSYENLKEALNIAIEALKQKDEIGEWHFNSDPRCGDFVCSKCLERSIECSEYCPNCGVKMKV